MYVRTDQILRSSNGCSLWVFRKSNAASLEDSPEMKKLLSMDYQREWLSNKSAEYTKEMKAQLVGKLYCSVKQIIFQTKYLRVLVQSVLFETTCSLQFKYVILRLLHNHAPKGLL